MKMPLRMSIRKRWSAKPSTSTSSDAPAMALRPLTPASCVIANSVTSDVRDVAHGRLHERDECLVALEASMTPVLAPSRIDVLGLVAPDQPLREALATPAGDDPGQHERNRDTATVCHGSAQELQLHDPLHAAGYRVRSPVAVGRVGTGHERPVPMWGGLDAGRSDRAATAVAVPAEQADEEQHDRDDDGNLQREDEEPAEHDASRTRMSSKGIMRPFLRWHERPVLPGSRRRNVFRQSCAERAGESPCRRAR